MRIHNTSDTLDGLTIPIRQQSKREKAKDKDHPRGQTEKLFESDAAVVLPLSTSPLAHMKRVEDSCQNTEKHDVVPVL